MIALKIARIFQRTKTIINKRSFEEKGLAVNCKVKGPSQQILYLCINCIRLILAVIAK
jgi:hypothetical protein